MGKAKTSAQRRTLAVIGGYQRDGQPYTETTAQHNASWVDQVSFGDNVPKWKSQMVLGSNVSTTMIGQRAIVMDNSFGDFRQTTSPVNQNYETRGKGQLLQAYLPANPLLIPFDHVPLLVKARTLAEMQFSKRFNRHTTQFETGVFAGELLQTVRMLVNPAKDLRNSLATFHRDLGTLLKNIKRNEFRSGRTNTLRALKDAIAGSWLTWSFGVKPLMSDLDDAARSFRALASGRTFENVRFTGEGNAESGTVTNEIFTTETLGYLAHTGYDVTHVTTCNVGVTIRGAWKSDVMGGQMPVPMIFGTQFGDILPTAWELIPWSWFADYFTNIGDVLSVWSMRNVNFNWINETVRIRVERMTLPPPALENWEASGQPFSTKIHCEGPLRVIRYQVTRQPYANRWSPQLLVTIPGVRGTDQNRWLNIAAVLAMRKSPIN